MSEYQNAINPNDDQQTDSSLQNTSIDQPENPPTNMEVHHHPDLHHKKKHWKEYFLEFLMIFLAVTMGFFAESYREYLVELNKEKQFIFSMIEDLKSDTSVFHQYIDNWDENSNQIDTLVGLLNSGDIINKTGQIYTLERVATRNFTRPFYNSRTFEQMRSEE